jgi:ribonuclease BN (tRNA processing enzyme)
MKLKVLGCGDAFASEGRFNTSFLIQSESMNILIDCGASTLIRMKQEGITALDIDVIIITHFHGDHYGGLPFQIISNKFEHNRTKHLSIFGPKGIKEKVYALQEAMYPGTSPLIDEMGVSVVEIKEDKWFNYSELSILLKPVKHSPPSNPHGVKVKLEDKIFAFSGDTEWTDALISLAKDTDLFICECNNLNEDSPGHLSYKTIISKADKLKTKRLMLTHMGSEVIAVPKMHFERLEDGMEVVF